MKTKWWRVYKRSSFGWIAMPIVHARTATEAIRSVAGDGYDKATWFAEEDK